MDVKKNHTHKEPHFLPLTLPFGNAIVKHNLPVGRENTKLTHIYYLNENCNCQEFFQLSLHDTGHR